MDIAAEFEKFKSSASNFISDFANQFEAFRKGEQQQPTAAPVEQPTETPSKPTYFDRLKMAESGGDVTAKAKTSSAAGQFQFIEKTWKEYVSKYNFDYNLNDRFDPEKSLNVVKKFTEDNKARLSDALGYEPTDSQLYAAHFLGVRGALKFYNAPPNKLATDVVSKQTAIANKNIFFDSKTKKPRTVAQVHSLLKQKIKE